MNIPIIFLRNNKPWIFSLLFLIFAFSIQSSNIVYSENLASNREYKYLSEMGAKKKQAGDFLAAIEFFETAYHIAQNHNLEELKLTSLLELGILHWDIGKLDKSIEFYTNANNLARKLEIKNISDITQNVLSIYNHYIQAKEYRSSGDYQSSSFEFKKALNIAQEIDSKELELKCLRQLSLNYLDINDLQEFHTLNQKALIIANNLNHKQEQAKCLINIGLFYWKLDNYSQSLKYYGDAYDIAISANIPELQADCLNNISIVFFDLGDFDKARENLIKALDIDKRLNNESNISKDLNNLGETYRRRGVYSDRKEHFYHALNYYEESLKLARKINDTNMEIIVLNNIGSSYSFLNNYAKALEYFQLGLKKTEGILNIEAMGMILNNIGIVYSQLGNYEESTKYYQKAIDLALKIQGGKILWEAYLELANTYKNQKNTSAALDNYKKSISVIEDIRSGINLEELKATYLGSDKRIEAYFNIIDLLIGLHQRSRDKKFQAEAFSYLERAKARSFLDSIEVSKINFNEGISQKLLNQETELMNEISKLHTKLLFPQLSPEQRDEINHELESYEEQLESLKRDIRMTSPAYANLRYPATISLSEAQHDLVDEETAFFAYILGTEASYAFVITKRATKIFPCPERKEIQRLVREYLAVITDVESKNFHLGYELFNKLVRPGLDGLKIKRIIFAPDDILYFLPFETLLTREPGREWLIKFYDIAYVPSLSSLRELIERKKTHALKSKKDILALGDPYFGENEVETAERIEKGSNQDYYSTGELKFHRLKYSGMEIEKIASLFKSDKRDTLLREQASEEKLKKENLSDYKIIHLATHALIDDKKPARSAIVLNLDKDLNEDGFLQMREIFNLKLNADLVVLSACQTGLGQLIKGEGIEGLRRAFFYAGASSVLLSLWAINDQASFQLLERFYIYLRASYPILSSLRKAKLEMINSDVLSHPYYWAGFIITGETDKIVFPRRLNRWILVTLSLCAGLAILILVMNRDKNHLSLSRY